MATRRILAGAIYTACLPHIALARLAEFLHPSGLLDDLNKCIAVIDEEAYPAPSSLIEALLVAEDHRNHLHPGIDPIGILRASIAWMLLHKVQGASTIEQQFVRTVTGHRQRTIRRKLREQILAILLCRQRSKVAICSAYLSIAYFGHECIGLKSMKHVALDNDEGALRVVAHLKYPRPKNPTNSWELRIEARAIYLADYWRRLANNSAHRFPPFLFLAQKNRWPRLFAYLSVRQPDHAKGKNDKNRAESTIKRQKRDKSSCQFYF